MIEMDKPSRLLSSSAWSAEGIPWRASTIQSASARDRKSTRLNSSHQIISYAVFCLKKKKPQIRLLLPVGNGAPLEKAPEPQPGPFHFRLARFACLGTPTPYSGCAVFADLAVCVAPR